jgi:hypothetical protein
MNYLPVGILLRNESNNSMMWVPKIRIRNRLNTALLVLVGILLFVYVVTRAAGLSFTHDEALTYTIVNGSPQWGGTANNHILNTDLMKISQRCFGNCELALRLPNVLAYLIFLLACGCMILSSPNRWILFTGISLLLLIPFITDFFSLARGYGLSLALVSASLFFQVRHRTPHNNWRVFIGDAALTMLFAALALRANFTTINFYIAMMMVIIIRYAGHRFVEVRSVRKYRLWLGFIMLVSIYPLAFGLQRLYGLYRFQQLYYGADSFDESYTSLVMAALFQTKYHWTSLVVKIIIPLILGAAVISLSIIHI